MIRSGNTGVDREHKHVVEYSLKLDSNAEFTASVLVACARAVKRMNEQGIYGCKTMFDVPPAYLCADDRETLISQLMDAENDSFTYTLDLTDGTYFVAYGDASKKIRWLHADYSNNDPGRKYKGSYTKAINKYDKIIAISQGVGDNFNKKYHKENITDIIYNLIDKSVPKKKDNKSNEFMLVAVGRLNYIKGYSRLISVIDRLNQEGLFDNAILKIVGSGEEEDNYETL